MSLVHFTVY